MYVFDEKNHGSPANDVENHGFRLTCSLKRIR